MRKGLLRLWLLMCLGSVLVGCTTAGQQLPTPTPLPALVEPEKVVFRVERGPIVSQRDFYGEVVPAQQDELFFRAAGYVTRVTVKAGDTVKQGEVMAELQLDDLLDQLAQARIDLQIAEDNAENERLQRLFEIQKAESDVAILQKQIEQAQKRLQGLYGQAKEAAQAELEILGERLQTAQAWLALVEGKKEASLTGLIERNRLTVERLERLVAERQIVAPYDGIVLNSYLRLGSQIDAFVSAFVVGDPSSLAIRIAYENELARVLEPSTEAYLSLTRSKEQLYPVRFQPDFLPVTNKKEGVVASGGGISLTYFYFSPPEDLPLDQLPLGGGVTLVIVLGKKDDALLLAPAAIRGNESFRYVIVLEDDTHRRVEVVSVGLKGEKWWEVKANLNEGDLVLGP